MELITNLISTIIILGLSIYGTNKLINLFEEKVKDQVPDIEEIHSSSKPTTTSDNDSEELKPLFDDLVLVCKHEHIYEDIEELNKALAGLVNKYYGIARSSLRDE